MSYTLLSRRYFSTIHTQFEPIKFNQFFDYLDHLLQISPNSKQSKQIHAQIVHFDGLSTIFLPSRLISIYGKFNLINDAQKVFKTLPFETLFNPITWNSMLRANVSNNEYQETLKDYNFMRNVGVLGDEFTFPLVIRACAVMGYRKLCDSIHCRVFVSGLEDNVYVANELLAGYGKLGDMGVARQVFDEMFVRNYVSWNTMVSGFAFNFDCDGAFKMFKRMEFNGLEPNDVTWTSLLSSYSRCGRYWDTLRLYNLMRSKGVEPTGESVSVVVSVCNGSDFLNKIIELHGYVITVGFENYSFVKNSLLYMYGKHGKLGAAEKLFSEIKTKNLVTWNALISSYTEAGLCNEAFSAFLNLKSSEGNLAPNVISWSAIITGFASNGKPNESLNFFRQMQLAKVKPNAVTISSLLSVCADLSTLVNGKEIHGYIVKNLTDSNSLVTNGLINMYSKCGSLNEAHKTFNNIKLKDLCSWNTMIKGFGMHGHGETALKIFNQMVNDGYNPDGVTFVSLLSACSHAGLVNKGRNLFTEMKTKFGIEPEMQHYACLVDLLGRAGLFQEASEVAKKMPIEPNVCVWGALLSSGRMNKNVVWDNGSVSKILGVSSATGNYMLLSNIYAQSGRWEDSARVRVSARARGLTKTPGQSWIELNKKVHMFTAGEVMESEMKEVQTVVEFLSFEMKMEYTY